MPTIAELQVKINAQPITDASQALNQFAESANKANTAAGKLGSSSPQMVQQGETRKVADLSAAIDDQTRKLQNLAKQRKDLESSNMKSTAPQEYERLNRIIDANIERVRSQGTAVERLATQQNRITEQKVRAADSELAMQDRLARATERRELVVTNAAAREHRMVEQTINGLDRQVKAQNEYNAAVETLSRARALSGMSGPGDNRPSLSGAEFDTFVKQAAAQRDAQLAIQDTSREMERAKTKLDTYTATLGKAERAEVQFARATDALNVALKNGVITQEQYDSKLSQFAAHRDAVVAGAERNIAAEERFERQLRSTVTAYDPVARAQHNYNTAIDILSTGLQTGSLSVEQFNKALSDQVQALDRVKASQGSKVDIGSEYDDAIKSVLPYREELERLELQQKRLQAGYDAGKVVTTQQKRDYDQATRSISEQTAVLRKRIAAGNDASMSYKQEQAALRGMPAQITDIVVSLQGGQAPLTVLLQQGGQIKDMFGGIGPAIKGMTTAVLAMVNPFTVGATVLTLLGAAAYSGSQEVNEFNQALTKSRGISGQTASDFATMSQALSQIEGTAGKAAEAMVLMETSGRIAAGSYEAVALAAITMQKATGQAMSETIDDFASLGKDPVDAAVRLDEKYRFLTASVLSQAQALEEQGRTQEAVVLLQNRLAEASTETAQRLIDDAGWIEKAWHGVKSAISGAWDAMKDIGRESTAGQELADIQAQMGEIRRLARDNEAALARNSRYQELANEERILKIRVEQEKQLAQNQGKREENERKNVAYQAQLGSSYQSNLASLDKVQAAEEKLNKTRRDQEAFRRRAAENGEQITEQTIKQMDVELRAAQEGLKDAKEAQDRKDKPRGPLNTTGIQETKSALKAITTEYSNHYKEITALGQANVVSERATYYSQLAILEAQRKAVDQAYGDQVSAITKAKDGKKLTASQSISLDNQMTKAEAERLKALEDIDSKMQQLQIRETGRLQERDRNVKAYADSMREQLRAVEEEGQRAVAGRGRGDRQAGVDRQLGDNDRWFAKESRRLSETFAQDKDAEAYEQKLASLTANHTAMKDQILANDREIQAANYDWTNGFTAAVENAQDAGMNFAGSMQTALTGAFTSAGDALATFVTTGQFSFKQFASSVIADMARIAAQQAAMGALGAIFNIAGAAFGGWMGAGAAAGSSGSFGQIGGSYTGSGVFGAAQAQGGAWSGGTQLFAQGGAFTNSVVSTPTAFGMANGARGIMGEAGDEAIVPLARTRNGDLGVRMTGDMPSGGNATVVNVNVMVSESGSQSTTDNQAYDKFGNDLGQFVRQEVYTVINKETRPGGSLQPAKA